MFCSYCGTKVNENDNVCSSCGARLNSSQPNNYSQQSYHQQNYQQQYQPLQFREGGCFVSIKPPNYTLFLILAIVQTLCCSLPFGIAAIILNEKAKNAFIRNDMYEYEKKKKATIIVMIVGAVLSLIIAALYFILTIAAATSTYTTF